MADPQATPTSDAEDTDDQTGDLEQAELDAQREAEATLAGQVDTDEQTGDDADDGTEPGAGGDGAGEDAGATSPGEDEDNDSDFDDETYLTQVVRTVDFQELGGIRREVQIVAIVNVPVDDDEDDMDEAIIVDAVMAQLHRDYRVDPAAPQAFVVG